MIPTIEQIVEGVKDGSITASQAVSWLHQHAEGAANDLRDGFAMAALPGLLVRRWEDASGSVPKDVHAQWANAAYLLADAMMLRRADDGNKGG